MLFISIIAQEHDEPWLDSGSRGIKFCHQHLVRIQMYEEILPFLPHFAFSYIFLRFLLFLLNDCSYWCLFPRPAQKTHGSYSNNATNKGSCLKLLEKSRLRHILYDLFLSFNQSTRNQKEAPIIIITSCSPSRIYTFFNNEVATYTNTKSYTL